MLGAASCYEECQGEVTEENNDTLQLPSCVRYVLETVFEGVPAATEDDEGDSINETDRERWTASEQELVWGERREQPQRPGAPEAALHLIY